MDLNKLKKDKFNEFFMKLCVRDKRMEAFEEQLELAYGGGFILGMESCLEQLNPKIESLKDVLANFPQTKTDL